MIRRLEIHPENPQRRQIRQVAESLRAGELIVYPTDSCYAFGCAVGDKASMEAIRRLRQAGPGHNFTLVCRDLSELSVYARVDNAAYRMLKAYTPGPYTFILEATREVPRRLMVPKRRTIGLRIPDHRVVQALLEEYGEPLMSCTLMLPELEEPPVEPYDLQDRLKGRVAVIIDSGFCRNVPTTVLDLTPPVPEVRRLGGGAYPLA